MNLTQYVKAGFPLISIKTHEIKRAVKSIIVEKPFSCYRWDAINGIQGNYVSVKDLIDFTMQGKQAVFVLESFNWFFDSSEGKGIIQAILNNLELYKTNQVCLVIISKENINPFFDKIVHKIDFALPTCSDFVPASLFGFPLVSANIAQLKDSLVGETEKRTKLFTDTVDSIGSCVLLLDEIEKMFGSNLDSGVSKGQLGHFLTWLNDRQSQAIIVATANNLQGLPAEFLRAGRWDCIFFIDYPNNEERKEIIQIMNKKYKTDLPESLSERLENFSGAEIEQLAKDSHFDEIDYLVENMPTLFRTQKEKVSEIRSYGKNYRKANQTLFCQPVNNQQFARVIN